MLQQPCYLLAATRATKAESGCRQSSTVNPGTRWKCSSINSTFTHRCQGNY
ncbi:MAG: hypothetical protein ACREIA_06580 [Opitutaceae bacterium]